MMQSISAKQYNISIQSETKDQIALAELLDRVKCNSRSLRWCHIPNEGKRSGKSGKILQMMGLKKGLPDIFIFDSPPNYPDCKGAVIELKKENAGRISPTQLEWNLYFVNTGWVIKIANGLNEAIEALRDWGYI